MGETHRSGAIGVGGFVVGEPAQLGGGDRRDRDHSHLVHPLLRPAEVGDEFVGGGTGPGVVPQQRISHHLTGFIETHHAVLLRSDGYRCYVVETPGSFDRRPEGLPPLIWMHLGARRVWRATRAHDAAVGYVAHHHLAGLGRRIDSCDQHGVQLLSARSRW